MIVQHCYERYGTGLNTVTGDPWVDEYIVGYIQKRLYSVWVAWCKIR
jgi:hypothetical protein